MKYQRVVITSIFLIFYLLFFRVYAGEMTGQRSMAGDTVIKIKTDIKTKPMKTTIKYKAPQPVKGPGSSGSETETPNEPVNTLVTGTFTDDRDGNVYPWVAIGNQVWMSRNLAWLPAVSPPSSLALHLANYYVYDYNGTDVAAAKATQNYQVYGVLYNWTAAMNGSSSSSNNPSGVQGVCPAGWHLPSDAEWKEMEMYFGMPLEVAETPKWRGEPVGKILKSTSGWSPNGNNADGTNESGFTAIPNGMLHSSNGGKFYHAGNFAYFWTATQLPPSYAGENPMHAWLRALNFNLPTVYYYVEAKSIGAAVRCVRD